MSELENTHESRIDESFNSATINRAASAVALVSVIAALVFGAGAGFVIVKALPYIAGHSAP